MLSTQRTKQKYFKRTFSMKTVEEVAAKVKNAKIYSVLEASNGYWQIRLTKDSQKHGNVQLSFLKI